jgi:hypothetical protein
MTYVYKNLEFVINQPALWCNSCGEGTIDGKDSNNEQETHHRISIKIISFLK